MPHSAIAAQIVPSIGESALPFEQAALDQESDLIKTLPGDFHQVAASWLSDHGFRLILGSRHAQAAHGQIYAPGCS